MMNQYPAKPMMDQMAQYGRYGDSMLVHMNPVEVAGIASLSPTGQLTTNPVTGQPEAFLPLLFGGLGSVVGAVAGGIKFQEASTTLTLSDVRSTIQVAAASGTYKKSDWAFGGVLGAVGGGAYTSTDEGKIVAGALLDNYNNIVRDVRDNPSLLESTSAIGQQNAAASLQAVNFQPGALLKAKLANVKVLDGPERGADVVGKLQKGEEVVFMGESEEGYLLIQGSEVEGWVQEFMLDG